jgi:hypothetical protein
MKAGKETPSNCSSLLTLKEVARIDKTPIGT